MKHIKTATVIMALIASLYAGKKKLTPIEKTNIYYSNKAYEFSENGMFRIIEDYVSDWKKVRKKMGSNFTPHDEHAVDLILNRAYEGDIRIQAENGEIMKTKLRVGQWEYFCKKAGLEFDKNHANQKINDAYKNKSCKIVNGLDSVKYDKGIEVSKSWRNFNKQKGIPFKKDYVKIYEKNIEHMFNEAFAESIRRREVSRVLKIGEDYASYYKKEGKKFTTNQSEPVKAKIRATVLRYLNKEWGLVKKNLVNYNGEDALKQIKSIEEVFLEVNANKVYPATYALSKSRRDYAITLFNKDKQRWVEHKTKLKNVIGKLTRSTNTLEKNLIALERGYVKAGREKEWKDDKRYNEWNTSLDKYAASLKKADDNLKNTNDKLEFLNEAIGWIKNYRKIKKK